MKQEKKVYQQGQAVLIVLLVVVVALSFGLSIISQSITDVQISGQSEESVRTFNAAEAGIEAGLRTLTIGQNVSLGGFDNIDVKYSVASENYLETTVSENDTVDVVVNGAGTLWINWVKGPGENTAPLCSGVSGGAPASLLISVIDSTGVNRTALNACNIDNDFIYVNTGGDNGYLKKYSLAVSGAGRVKIRPIYNQATIRVTSRTGEALPAQTYKIDSLAQSDTKESKAIQVSRTVAATPTIFDFVLFSGNNIIK